METDGTCIRTGSSNVGSRRRTVTCVWRTRWTNGHTTLDVVIAWAWCCPQPYDDLRRRRHFLVSSAIENSGVNSIITTIIFVVTNLRVAFSCAVWRRPVKLKIVKNFFNINYFKRSLNSINILNF